MTLSSSTGQRLAPLDMLARLVAFDTVSHKSNLELIAFVEDYLAGWGVSSIRIPNATGDKAALFATIGPQGQGGILLSGHTDVVPVEGQAWSRDPFTLHIADGRAYGRGAVDMKGFIALALALVPDFLAADLKTPIHLFFSYDEEVTCLGVVDGIARMGVDLPKPRAVIVGEPTSLELADAHKGIRTFFTTITGVAAHSSKPHLGASAVHGGIRLTAGLVAMADELEASPDGSGRFDPPYDTVHVGKFHGGIARNILADRCDLSWEVRTLPGSDPEDVPARFAALSQDVLERMRRTAPSATIETVMSSDVPGLAPDPGSEAETLVMRLAGRNRTIAVAYATEAGHFQRAGRPTIVCGPGSIDQAHQPDEYITLEQFAAGEAFMRKLMAECRG
ncbi:MAG: acetylornithine deacetylase [Bosea sp. (in: a-proteobacteria)]|uniref:acetylornithine deacetylase n=1 Tax=Bosea sp. (in: a-proteobacteria) TaxID=1871050 RepID=UPI0027370FB2|nr:acetylornithine deacetylase [Bosea sp. (in: a-proteobacteria)]MDP3254772.1 acetylornithine deacetylase [Bosea sp. (in: a-proteobacteria)]MDP3321629.1 acetylornithine deacetylase [Bosea sp. (in: a-proteobacteria)]